MTRTLIVSGRGSILAGLMQSVVDATLETTTCTDSAAALEFSRQKPPEIVILDTVEPGFASIHELTPLWHLWHEAYVFVILPADLDAAARSVLALGVHGVVIDPFDLRQLQSTMERAIRYRADAESRGADALATFLHGISHHVLNPLNNISGLAQILAMDEEEGSERNKRYQMILKEAERIQEIVRDLDLFLKTRKPTRSKVQPMELLESIVDSLSREQQVSVSVESDAVEATLFGDRVLIHKALTELVLFAAGESPREPVAVRLRSLENSVLFQIQSSAEIPLPTPPSSIFIPFASFHKPDRPGTLQLATAYGIIRNHHGRVDVIPQSDGTLHIRVELPLTPPLPPAARQKTATN